MTFVVDAVYSQVVKALRIVEKQEQWYHDGNGERLHVIVSNGDIEELQKTLRQIKSLAETVM